MQSDRNVPSDMAFDTLGSEAKAAMSTLREDRITVMVSS